MTNYNERLDEILERYDDQASQDEQNYRQYRTEAKQAILEWHNKQIEEVLDRLRQPTLQDVGLMQPDQYEGGKIINNYWVSAIEAERNRLKESKDE